MTAADDLLAKAGKTRFSTVLADPPWQFQNRTGKMAPEHKRLSRYGTMTLPEICGLPVEAVAADTAHLYLWVPGSLLPEALTVCGEWGFDYKALLTWVKPGLGLGNYWRVATEHIVFGVRGRLDTQAKDLRNWFNAPRARHSAKPDEFYELVERASPGPYIDLFARRPRLRALSKRE